MSIGPFAVRLAGDESFPLEPPRLAREVDVTEPSESARTFRFAATTVADPPMDALVRCVTFASAIPAPPVAALASPLADAATRFVAEIVRSPVAVIDVEPATLTVAVLLMSAPATATSAPGVPSPGLATAIIGAVSVDAAARETPPVELITEAPGLELFLNLFEVGSIILAEPARHAQTTRPRGRVAGHLAKSLGQRVQSLFRTEPLWSFAA